MESRGLSDDWHASAGDWRLSGWSGSHLVSQERSPPSQDLSLQHTKPSPGLSWVRRAKPFALRDPVALNDEHILTALEGY
jgi:hypothetical protein